VPAWEQPPTIFVGCIVAVALAGLEPRKIFISINLCFPEEFNPDRAGPHGCSSSGICSKFLHNSAALRAQHYLVLYLNCLLTRFKNNTRAAPFRSRPPLLFSSTFSSLRFFPALSFSSPTRQSELSYLPRYRLGRFPCTPPSLGSYG
jgi:hypothetical protein